MKGYRSETLKGILAKYENAPVELLEELTGAEEDFGEGTYTEDEVNARIEEATSSIKADYDERFRKAFFSGVQSGTTVEENGAVAPDEPSEEIELSKAESVTVDDLLKPADSAE